MSEENDSEEDAIYIEPQFLLSDQDFTFEQIPTEKFDWIRTVRDRESGFIRGCQAGQANLLTPANSIWFQRRFFDSLKLIQSFTNCSKLEEHIANVQSVAFSESGERLCSGGNDLKIAIWDWKEENLSHIYYSGHILKVRQCKWTVDNKSIITCSDDNHVRISHLEEAGITSSKVIATHQGPVNSISLCDVHCVLSCGEDGSVRWADLREDSPKELVSLSKKQMSLPLYSIDCNANLKPHQFVISGEGPSLRVYDRRFIFSHKASHCLVMKPDHCPKVANFSSTCCQISPFNSSHVLASYNNSDLYIFDIDTNKVIKKLIGHCCRPILNKCCWFGERFVFSTSSDGYVYAWDIDNMHPIFCSQADEVNSIAVHPSEPFFATCGSNCDVKLWSQEVTAEPFNYVRLKQRVVENLNERRIYEYYCSYLEENQEKDILSSVAHLFENRLFRSDSASSEDSSDHEDYDTFEELECIPS